MMKTNILIAACLFPGLMVSSVSVIANSEFQQWILQQSMGVEAQKKEFQEYKDRRDKEFTDFLKTHWKSVDIVKGEVADEVPKPNLMPVAPKVPVPVAPANKPAVVTVPESKREPGPIKKPEPIPAAVTQGKRANVDFYGRQVVFYYDADLRKKLNQNINKEAVSDYWSALSRAEYEGLLNQLNEHKHSLQLNDWAYASLIYKLAEVIDHNRSNESALLSWFLLAKSGYKARIAFDHTYIYLLVPSKHEMFEVSYFTFSGKRYYAVEFNGGRQQLGQVYTYDGEYPDATKEFDMRVTPVVASNDKDDRRHLSFEFEGKKYNIDVTYDRGRVKFLSTYPQLSLDLYFGSGVYKVTATPLQKQLATHMQGMSEQQAVNFLLRFVQTSLQYETDKRQFGAENYLFPEETLFYPYSDCEDRAVLFAWLVQSMLNLQVVGLDYPGHVAAAVHFNDDIAGDSVVFNGKRYVVTDPTYTNASAGMTMPAFKKFEPTVIKY